jgi:hypothetical protein
MRLDRRWTAASVRQRPGIIDSMASRTLSRPSLSTTMSNAVFTFHDSYRISSITRWLPFSANYACIPNPGSMPACLSALAFRASSSFFSAFCAAAKARTSSTGANLTPLGTSSRSRSTVAQMVTFSPLIVMSPGSLTSCISHLGMVGSEVGDASGLRAAILS